MKNSFTLNELISFVSGEKNVTNMDGAEIACQTDSRKLSNSEMLDSDLCISPDKRIINSILSYSRALTIIKTKRTGNFNLMMN